MEARQPMSNDEEISRNTRRSMSRVTKAKESIRNARLFKREVGKAERANVMEEKYGIELELLTDSFEKKVKNIKKQAESIQKAFDPNDTSGMTITGLEKNKKRSSSYERRIEPLNDGFKEYNSSAIRKYVDEWEEAGPRVIDIVNVLQNGMIQVTASTEQANTALQEVNQTLNDTATKESAISNLANSFKRIVSSGANKAINGIKTGLKKISSESTRVKTNMQKAFNGSHLKIGLKNILKYVTALFSIRSIYTALSQAARAWLSSQNEGAQQLSANIEYLRYSLGSVFAPVIQYITDLVYNLMKAIQSLIYSFTGMNIFANATAKSMKGAAGSAKEASKALAPFDELNNLDSQSGGGGSGEVAPTYDLTQVETKFNSWFNTMKEKLSKFFEPITASWNTYGEAAISSVKSAFEGVIEFGRGVIDSYKVILSDGTVQTTTDLILRSWIAIFETIGNAGRAYANAWKNDGNGTKIIHNIWDGFNNIFELIVRIAETFEEFTHSDNFQFFANAVIKICETLSYWFKIVTDKLMEIWENGGKRTFEKLLTFFGKVVEAIGAVLNALTPLIEGILNIVAPVIEFIIKLIGYVIDALSGVLDFIIGIFTGNWERAWNGIVEFFKGIANAIGYIMAGAANVVIFAVESLINMVISGLNFILGGISAIASAVGSLIGLGPVNLRLGYVSLPRVALATGTNYVPEDQLAYIHKGEAVIPKKFNSQEYFGNDDETKALLAEIKEAINNIEINPYTTIKDVGKTAVNYINSRSRQLGGSVIS